MDLNNLSARVSAAQTQQLLNEDRTHMAESRQEMRGSQIEGRVLAALQGEQQSALQDTVEDLSLALGSRFKDLKNKADKTTTDPRNDALEQLAEGADLSMHNIAPGDVDTLMSLLSQDQIPLDQALLLMASWLGREGIDAKKRKTLSDKMTELMDANPQWALEMFASIELGAISQEAMGPLLQVMQRYQQQEEREDTQGMWEWFEQIQHWPQRKERIRVLLRTLALELAVCTDEAQKDRLIATLLDLKKLLLFLGIEDHSRRLAQAHGLNPELVMEEILKTVEQTWINVDWITQRLRALNIYDEEVIPYLGRFKDVLKFLPGLCFLDEEQRMEILEAFTMLYDHLSEDE